MHLDDALVHALFSIAPAPVEDVRVHINGLGRHPSPIDGAILGGASADRLAYAFVAGYRAALRVLAPAIEAPIVSLCATEEGGAHPRAIATTLAPDGEGTMRLRGVKTFATLADVADVFLVLASVGAKDGKNLLRVVSIPRDRDGVVLRDAIETPFCPEVRHAVIAFEGVRVEPAEILDGDGWDDLVKPFRTIEDVHVIAAVLASLFVIAAARSKEALLASIVAARAIASLDPKRPETHLAVAGWIDQAKRAVDDADLSACAVEVRERFARDRRLLEVASKARAMRREAAWNAINAPRTTASPNR